MYALRLIFLDSDHWGQSNIRRLRFAWNVQRLCGFIIFERISQKPLDKLELIIREKQAELRSLQAELNDALTGIESPDYERASRLQPLIYGVEVEIKRL